MAKITTLDSVSKLLKYITITLPPFITKNEDSYIRQFISSICEVFKINIDQLNQMFNNTFISQAEEGDLDKLILDLLEVSRKNGETDSNYRQRALKYAFQYNATKDQINEIVYDTLGYYPIKLTENSIRSGYWGEENLPLEEQINGTAYYYDDIENYMVYWGANEEADAPNWLTQIDAIDKSFVGIIHLLERPTDETLNELCDVIERVRKKGTKIYLQFLDDIDQILAPSVTVVEEDAISYRWTLVPSANFYEVQIDTDPLFGSPTTYITTNTNYNFTGLSSGITYYTRVRYTNTDGDTYSDWTAPTESTTPSSIGTPIATEETNVGVSGKLTNIFTANWGSASGATSYIVTIANDLALTVPISGFNQLNVGNVVFKDVILDLETDSNELISWKLNDNDINITSATVGGLSGTLNGTANWLSSLVSSDTYSIKLDGTSNNIQTTNQSTVLNDFTIRMLIRFQSGDKASLATHTLFSKYNTSLSNPSADGGILYIDYDSTLNILSFVVSDSTSTFALPKYRIWQCNYNLIEETDYLIQCSFMLSDPSNSNNNTVEICINGVNQTISVIETITNIDSISSFSCPYYLGSYTTVGGTNYYGKFKCARCYFSTRFRTIDEAVIDAKNLGLITQTLYYGIKATDGVNISPYSNIITVNKPILQDFQKDIYTTSLYKFNNNYQDETLNNNDAIGINSPTFTTALLSGDTYSILLDGVNDLIQLPNTVSSTRDITVRMVLSFNSFTRSYQSLYNEWYGEAFGTNYVAKITIDYDKSNNRFLIELYDDSYNASPNNTKAFGFYGNISLNTSTKYYIAFSWDNTTKTALLKVNNSIITLTDAPLIPPSSITQATLNLQDSISPKPIYFGGITYPNVPYTNNSPHCTLARLAVDSVARDNTYLTQDWTNISSRL